MCFFKKLHLTSLSFKSASRTISSNVQDGFPCQDYIQEYHLGNQKQKQVQISSFYQSLEYAGACANPNGHLLNSHLPKEEMKHI